MAWLGRVLPTWCPGRPTCLLALSFPATSLCLATPPCHPTTPTQCPPPPSPTTIQSPQPMPIHRQCLQSQRHHQTCLSVWRSRPVCPAQGVFSKETEISWMKTLRTRRMLPHPGPVMCSGLLTRTGTQLSGREGRVVRAAVSLVGTTAPWWRGTVRVGHLRLVVGAVPSLWLLQQRYWALLLLRGGGLVR